MYHQNTLKIFSPQYLGMFAVILSSLPASKQGMHRLPLDDSATLEGNVHCKNPGCAG